MALPLVITNINPKNQALTAAISIKIGGANVSDEGAQEFYGRDGSTMIRTLRCRWEDRGIVINALRSASFQGSGSLILGFGQPYPDAPYTFVSSIQVDGGGQKGINLFSGMIAYEYATLRVTYTSGFETPYETGSISFSSGTEVFSIPRGAPYLKYTSGPLSGTDVPIMDSPPFICPVLNIVRTMSRINNYPQAKISNALQAPVNDAAFSIAADSFRVPGSISSEQFANMQGGNNNNTTGLNGATSFPIGSVMFMGVDASKSILVGGFSQWTLAYRFKVRFVINYNQVLTPSGGIVTFQKKDNTELIPRSNLNTLFDIT